MRQAAGWRRGIVARAFLVRAFIFGAIAAAGIGLAWVAAEALADGRVALAAAERAHAAMTARAQRLRAEAAAIDRVDAPVAPGWPGPPNAAAARAQERLSAWARTGGVALRSVAALDRAPLDDVAAVGFALEAEGPYDAAEALLRRIETADPPLLVTRANLRALNRRAPDGRHEMIALRLEIAAPLTAHAGWEPPR